jgi:hypothetical protein
MVLDVFCRNRHQTHKFLHVEGVICEFGVRSSVVGSLINKIKKLVLIKWNLSKRNDYTAFISHTDQHRSRS